MQVLMFFRMRRWRKDILTLVDMRFRAARAATVAGAMRTTVMMVTTTAATVAATAATMTPNGNKQNNQILSRHQW
jgi:hypothetical protein